MTSLTLPWPPSNNTYYRRVGAKTLISEKGRSYTQSVAKLCWATRTPKHEGRLRVEITAYPPNRATRDLDNLFKALLDSLTKAGVWNDDSQIDDLRIIRGPVKAGGLVQIEIGEHPCA